eukprot:6668727-Karenia_brevis.AAC.1
MPPWLKSKCGSGLCCTGHALFYARVPAVRFSGPFPALLQVQLHAVHVPCIDVTDGDGNDLR